MHKLFLVFVIWWMFSTSATAFTSSRPWTYNNRGVEVTTSRTKLEADPSFILDTVAGLLKVDVDSVFDLAKIGLPSVGLFGIFSTLPPSQLLSKSLLNAIAAGTFLENRNLVRVYKASKNGWSAVNFHDAVDGRGSAVVVCRGVAGQTFGGYNPNGWRSTDDYYSSISAFLWCLKGSKVVKLPVLPGGNAAIFDYASGGPCFGSCDLMVGPPQAAVMGFITGPDAEDITKSAGSLRQCKSSIGTTYENNSAWPVRGNMKLVEVEVYCNGDS
jgi:hypothetical protein